MSTKAIVPGALVMAWLCGGTAQARPESPYGLAAPEPAFLAPVKQEVPATVPMPPVSSPIPTIPPPAAKTPPPPPDTPIAAITGVPALPAGSVCSPWTGPGGTGCCGPIGGNGPIGSELYARFGISMPVAGGIFNNTLNAGYALQGGGRSLFYNVPGSAAWTVEYGIDYTYNNGNHPEREFDIRGLFFNIRDYHRVGVHLAGGREWFLYTPAYQTGTNLRFGVDAGGRYGYSRLNLNLPDVEDQTRVDPATTRLNDTYGSTFGVDRDEG